MPILTPTGDFGQYLQAVRAALSRSANFRAWVGAADATAALGSIRPSRALASELASNAANFAVVKLARTAVDLVAFSPPTFTITPVVVVGFFGVEPSTPTDYADPETWLVNAMGPIAKDIATDDEGPTLMKLEVSGDFDLPADSALLRRCLGTLRLTIERTEF